MSLAQILVLLKIHKYLVLFPFTMLEGPIVTVLAGLLASLGYMNVWLVYIIVVLGDVLGDLVYYFVGRWGGRPFLLRWGKYVSVDATRLAKVDLHFQSHAGKTLVIGKLTHAIGPMVLVGAGLSKVPVLRFLLYTFLPTLPKSLVLLFLGYFFGNLYEQIDSIIGWGTFALLVTVCLAVALYFLPSRLRRT